MFTTDQLTAVKNDNVVVTLTDGTQIEGTFISINSKGFNVKAANGKTITRTLSVISSVEVNNDPFGLTDDELSDAIEDDAIDAEYFGNEDDEDDEDELTDEEYADAVDPEDDSAINIDPKDDESDEELGEGMTTADVAAIFDIPAKELRVITRKLGLGVGRGRTYSFDGEDVAKIRKAITEAAKPATV